MKTIFVIALISINYKNNKGIEGVIFTKEYFGNSKYIFTPTIEEINNLEMLILKEKEDFTDFYRRYEGNLINNERIISVILFPKKIAENEYPQWKKKYIYIKDDNRLRSLIYKNQKIKVAPKENFSV